MFYSKYKQHVVILIFKFLHNNIVGVMFLVLTIVNGYYQHSFLQKVMMIEISYLLKLMAVIQH